MVGVDFENRHLLSMQLPQLCLLQVVRVTDFFMRLLSDLKEISERISGRLGHSIF